MQEISTRSPGRTERTSRPVSTTSPTASWPRTVPGRTSGTSPFRMCRSVPQTVTASTRTIASVESLRTGSAVSSQAASPGPWKTYALMSPHPLAVRGGNRETANGDPQMRYGSPSSQVLGSCFHRASPLRRGLGQTAPALRRPVPSAHRPLIRSRARTRISRGSLRERARQGRSVSGGTGRPMTSARADCQIRRSYGRGGGADGSACKRAEVAVALAQQSPAAARRHHRSLAGAGDVGSHRGRRSRRRTGDGSDGSGRLRPGACRTEPPYGPLS